MVNDSVFALRRILACVIVVFSSLAVPAGIVMWSVSVALTGKPVGFNSGELQYYVGPYKNGEIWRISLQLHANSRYAVIEEYRLKRLNLNTGVERDTGIVVRGPFCTRVWLKDDLYIYTGEALYKMTVTSLEKQATPPARSHTLHAIPFVYDEQLTMVVESDNGEHRLFHLKDGKWEMGRKVLFPGNDRIWYYDPQRDKITLLPITSDGSTSGRSARQSVLTVIQQGTQTHLFIERYPGFAAYRNGFEFADEDDDVVSALAPENSVHEVSGWEPIQMNQEDDHFDQMACNRDGPIFHTWGTSNRCVRRTKDGQYKTLTELQPNMDECHIFADPSNSTAYLLNSDHYWGKVTIRRIEGDVVQPSHVILLGHSREYLRRWHGLMFDLCLAWMAHLSILLGGTQFLCRRSIQATFGNGPQKVVLASTVRRAFAFCIDILIVVATLVYLQSLALTWPNVSEIDCCERLYECERFLSRSGGLQSTPTVNEAIRAVADTFLPRAINQWTLFLVVIVPTILLLVGRSIQESRYGTTPGKWLFGIRTVRSTLRSCGISRSLVRTILYWVDFPMLLTPLPAAVSMMLSPTALRLGDRTADTLVIRAGSISNEPTSNSDVQAHDG